MALRFKRKESVRGGVQRLACSRIQKMLRALDHCEELEAIHEVRTGIKQLRALLRMVRGALKKSDYRLFIELLKKAAALLAPVRDAQVKARGLAQLRCGKGTEPAMDVDVLERGLSDHSRKQVAAFARGTNGDRKQVIKKLRELSRGFGNIRVKRAGWTALGPGLKRTYATGRARFQAAHSNPTAQAFHEWRKRIKDLLYQVGFLCRIAPRRLTSAEADLRRLADLLGEDHDLCLLIECRAVKEFNRGHPAEAKLLKTSIEQRQNRLRQQALQLGSRLYRPNPSQVCRRLKKKWHRWRG